jgi:iron complex outermembrane receptor protein
VNAVKSIEILQDGASAVYGSDAIGGVVNIITEDDYDSFKVSGYTGQYQQGDGEISEFDVRLGAQGERSRGLIDISYTDQKSVNTADRPTSQYPLPGFPYGVSSGTPAGRFVFFDPVSHRMRVSSSRSMNLATPPTTTSTDSPWMIVSITSRSTTSSRRTSASTSSARPSTTSATASPSARLRASTTASRRARPRRCRCSSDPTAARRPTW